MSAVMQLWLLLVAVACCFAHTAHFTSPTQLDFKLNDVNSLLLTKLGETKVTLPSLSMDWMTVPISEVGQPDLPALRNSVILSTATAPKEDSSSWRVEVSNVKYTTIIISGTIPPRQPSPLLCGNSTVEYVEAQYGDSNNWYPNNYTVAELSQFHTFRDIQGAHITLSPFQYNPLLGEMRVVQQCTVSLVRTNTAAVVQETRSVDPEFARLYQFLYGNAMHHQHLLVPRGTAGSLLVITEKRFQSVADDYSAWVKSSQGLTVDQHTWDGEATAEDLKSKVVQPLYEKGLSFLMLIGKQLPFTAQKDKLLGKYACDQCYGQFSGTNGTVDVSVARLSVDTLDDAKAQLVKFKAYDSKSTASWNKHVTETAMEQFEFWTDEMIDTAIIKKAGLTADSILATPSNKSMVIDSLNKGAGIFSYMGHGSGKALCLLDFKEKDIQELTNDKMPFVFLDTACMNAEFQKFEHSFNEALMSHPTGGAIATVGGTTSEYAYSWFEQKCAFDLLLNGTVSRLGPWITGSLMCMYKAIPGSSIGPDYDKGTVAEAYVSVEERAVFGDPTMQLAFMQ